MPADNILRDSTPGVDLVAITPSDTVDLEVPIRGLIITVAGTVAVVTPQGNVVTLPAAMAVGVVHSIRAKRINAAGTTATGLIGVI